MILNNLVHINRLIISHTQLKQAEFVFIATTKLKSVFSWNSSEYLMWVYGAPVMIIFWMVEWINMSNKKEVINSTKAVMQECLGQGLKPLWMSLSNWQSKHKPFENYIVFLMNMWTFENWGTDCGTPNSQRGPHFLKTKWVLGPHNL